MNMKKIKEKKGFTLAELLVVVAIVGILVAISIPVFTAQRMKAVIATNKANIRAAKAAATAEFYSNSDLLDVLGSIVVLILHLNYITQLSFFYIINKIGCRSKGIAVMYI